MSEMVCFVYYAHIMEKTFQGKQNLANNQANCLTLPSAIYIDLLQKTEKIPDSKFQGIVSAFGGSAYGRKFQ